MVELPFISTGYQQDYVLNRPMGFKGFIYWGGEKEAIQCVQITVSTSAVMPIGDLVLCIERYMQGVQMLGVHCSLPFALSLGMDMVIIIEAIN